MYTTPRKVKQESRLRRTHSLTNTIPVTDVMDEEHCAGGLGTIDGSFEHFPLDPSSFLSYSEQNLAGGNPTANCVVFSNAQHLLPPAQQRLNGPSDSAVYCSRDLRPQNNQGQVVYQTHSTKFPIVREVTVTTRQNSNTKPPADGIPLSRNNLLQDSTLPPRIPSQSSNTLTDEQKALTLDSCTAKVIQQKLFADPTQTIRRRNSLDLQKFIQVFNEEQILMSSMQGRHPSESGAIQTPSLENTQNYKMYDSYNGNSNGVAYYNDSNSSNSLSLSSSTADSLDTVIYKTPQASGPSRNWREQIFTDSSSSGMQMDQGPSHSTRSKNNGYPEGSNQFQDHNHSTQFQQGPSQSYGVHNNNYGLEYRTQSQQHLHHMQHLSSTSSLAGSHNGPTSSLRTGNGLTNGNGNINAYSSQSQPHQSSNSSTNSHFSKQKDFTVSSTTGSALDKTKESTKLFPTKTYNHIKDMISSRFGNPTGGPGQTNPKGVLSSASGGTDKNLNNAASSNGSGGPVYNNGIADSCGGNIGLPTTSYNPHHHHSGGLGQSSYALQVTNGHGPPYYVLPQNASPESYNGGGGTHQVNNSVPPNSYRSPQLTDRKDVNTSFRKAIQQSTQKSNLTELSVQLRRSVADSQHFETNSQNFESEQQVLQNGNASELGHIERAHRALDKLLDPIPSSGQELTNSAGNYARLQFHAADDKRPYNTQQYTAHAQNDPSSRLKNGCIDTTSGQISHSTKTLSKRTFPGDLKKVGGQTHSSVQNSQATLGLPSVPLVRENGDGSSVIVDGISSKCSNPNGAETTDGSVPFRSTGLQVLAISPGTENASSSSECEVKGGQRVGSGQSHTTTDSGLGTVVMTKSSQHSANTNEPLDGLLGQHVKFNDNMAESISSGNDSEWVDIVEPEIRQILELERLKKAGKLTASEVQNAGNVLHPGQSRKSTVNSEAMSSSHPTDKTKENGQHDPAIIESSPKLPKKFDLSCSNKKSSHEVLPGSSTGQGPSPVHSPQKSKATKLPSSLLRSNSGAGQRSNPWATSSRQKLLLNDKGKAATVGRKDLVSHTKAGKLTRNAMSQILYSLNDDAGDMTSTTGGLDLESMLDGRDNSSEDDDLSTTIDTTDAHAIRRQLESLETMYTEVLKALGGKKQMTGSRHPPPVSSDLRHSRRRPYGSMSSLPSSVSSRPFRESRKRIEEKKKVKDIKSISRRFQRLESHVVTLARSVAHLSSEMRTQHLMVQEMESVRNELTQVRNLVLKSTAQSQPGNTNNSSGTGVQGRAANGRQGVQSSDWTTFRNALPSLTNPCRVKKLTQFFGDEPPLIRIFLKKLGYEKYAFHFEQERIGIMELPYLTEERLQKMGIPMGPRLRILQEAHLCLKPGAQFTVETQHNGGTGNLSVYVV